MTYCTPTPSSSSGSGPILVSASKYGSVQDELGNARALNSKKHSILYHGTGKKPVSWYDGSAAERLLLPNLLKKEGGYFDAIAAFDDQGGLINAYPDETKGKQILVASAGVMGWESAGHLEACFSEDAINDAGSNISIAAFSECGPDKTLCLVRIAVSEDDCGFIRADGKIVDPNPAGVLQMWAGVESKVPDGWLLCDGQLRDPNVDVKLFERIGYFYGQDGSNFRVPDLRGVTVRGVDKNGIRDPNNTSRTAMYPGGNEVENVGSYQSDSFQCHEHIGGTTTLALSETTIGSGGTKKIKYPSTVTYIPNTSGIVASSCGTPRTSNETRMKNIYLHYIISLGC
jgi:microcystin-dependent protein